MNPTESRRKEIIKLLESKRDPISGSKLAKYFGVSRQVIVQDIALLKAENNNIISTNKGYQLVIPKNNKRVIKVFHKDSQIEEELNIIVDHGGIIEDVFVEHEAYGTIRVVLNIKSRRDVKILLEDIENGLSTPLKKLTGDVHFHTISADKENLLDEIEENLREAKILVG